MESANLNCLRSIAVICVFVCHAVKMFGFQSGSVSCLGRIGVVLFFIHTALVLMMSMERNGANWFSFMTRRIFRIYPLAIVAVLIYFPLNIAQTSQGGIAAEATTRTFFINLALVQNLFHVAAIPGVLWSLPYEIQMYLLLPILFLAIRGKNKLDLISIWLVSAAVSMLAAALLPRPLAQFAQYVPCFMAGVICYGMNQSRRIPSFLFPVLVLSIVIIYSTSRNATAIPFWPGCLLLGLSIPLFREINNPVISKIFAFVAKHSFGIYLWHELILWFVARPFGLIGVVVSFALTLLAAWISFQLVEDPLIRVGKRISSRKQNSQSRPLLEPSLS